MLKEITKNNTPFPLSSHTKKIAKKNPLNFKYSVCDAQGLAFSCSSFPVGTGWSKHYYSFSCKPFVLLKFDYLSLSSLLLLYFAFYFVFVRMYCFFNVSSSHFLITVSVILFICYLFIVIYIIFNIIY